MEISNLEDAALTSDADLETKRDRILDLAEDMFAESGIDKVSLRAVAAAAGVNAAAIHYYFGSRDGLLRAIFIRRLSGPLEKQTTRLSEFVPSGKKEADLRRIMEDYIRPTADIHCAEDNHRFSRLLGQLSMHDENLPSDMFHYVQKEVTDAYTVVLAKVLAELSPSDLAWRLEFVIGIIGHASRVRARLEIDSPRKPAKAKADDLLPQLLSAAVAIFCASPTGVQGVP